MKFDRQRLKDMRTAKGVSQTQLARKVGRSRQTVINWENGACVPALEEIGKIGEALGVVGTFFINTEE